MQFQDELAGGVVLVRPALQSPDYVAGASGWAVKVDGSAEFNDVTIRGGTVVSGTALYYDGAPAAGSLFLAIAAQAGADEFGNPYGAGLTVGPVGGRQVQLVQDVIGGYISLDHNVPEEQLPGNVASRISAKGTPTQRILTQVACAQQTTGGLAAIQIFSGSLDGTIPPRVIMASDTGSGTTTLTTDHWQTQVTPAVASTNSALYVNGAAGHTGRLLRVALDGADRLTVDPAGNTAVAGALTAANIQSGGFSITPTVAGEWTANTAVNFPAAFATAPVVMLCCTGNGPASATTTELEWCLTGVTTTGFSARIRRGNLTQTNMSWLAVST